MVTIMIYLYFAFKANIQYKKTQENNVWDIQASRKVFRNAENIRKSPTQSTAMMYTFIHGLVDLNLSQHSETEKGLDKLVYLIESFLDLIFI
ncbi:hypothetical protein J2T13_003844 [Paenibacillus sp. DS2015]